MQAQDYLMEGFSNRKSYLCFRQENDMYWCGLYSLNNVRTIGRVRNHVVVTPKAKREVSVEACVLD